MKRSGFRKLLIKYGKDSVNRAERYVVDRWYDSFGERTDGVPGLETPEATEASRLRIYRKTGIPSRSIGWYRRYRVAAAAAMLVLGWFWYQQQTIGTSRSKQPGTESSRTISTGERQVKKIQLPDSSIMWLNANSQIVIKPGYGIADRQIQLAGEAFFQVAPDKAKAFIVHTPNIAIEVLGTSFNVRAYEELKTVNVSVSTGAVQVNDTANRHLSHLEAGQGMAYLKNDRTYMVSRIAAESNRLWTEGKVILEKASFEELRLALRNLYGLHLESSRQQVLENRYNLTLRSDQAEKDLLVLLSSITKTHYKKEGSHVTFY